MPLSHRGHIVSNHKGKSVEAPLCVVCNHPNDCHRKATSTGFVRSCWSRSDWRHGQEENGLPCYKDHIRLADRRWLGRCCPCCPTIIPDSNLDSTSVSGFEDIVHHLTRRHRCDSPRRRRHFSHPAFASWDPLRPSGSFPLT